MQPACPGAPCPALARFEKRPPLLRARRARFACLTAGVCLDYALDERVPDHVAAAEIHELDPLDPVQDALDLQEARLLTRGQVDLRLVAGDYGTRVQSQPREEHLHLVRGGV